MDNQYRIINQCLQLLKQSEMPTIKKLRVEIQLIQMKRLLLNDALPSEVRSGSCGEEVFEGLLHQMKGICCGGYDGEALSELMERISGMLSILGSEQASPPH
ncbi:hypothetical protein GMST_37690 [Geomonas silvestris]|uniref:Uncharacterized protein n=1 Tax=Geomonas silvestris TaxID=2740184 RepID=A0A6V8MND2_9BACT|nr:hypothetical protein [Geomonas silvestris]GFO61444.1 hypothetical protein GMST_37690 [Geomonas silvestris]